jgi:hypothetical protein
MKTKGQELPDLERILPQNRLPRRITLEPDPIGAAFKGLINSNSNLFTGLGTNRPAFPNQLTR